MNSTYLPSYELDAFITPVFKTLKNILANAMSTNTKQGAT